MIDEPSEMPRRGYIRPARHLLSYVAIVGCGLAVLAAVLPIGHTLRRAPTVPPSLTVSGPATRCLGEALVTRQSGIYLDVHVPKRGGSAENPLAGDRIGRGRIDRTSGQAVVRGTCAPRTALAERPWHSRFDVRALSADAVDRDDADHPVRAEVATDGTSFEGTIEKARAAAVGEPGEVPLTGTALAGRAFLATAAVILLAGAAGSLFQRLAQPRVIGEIFAGIVLGPSVVGALLPGITDFLFPIEVLQVVRVLAQFGLIFFMFLTGLSLDLGTLRGSGRVAVLVSHMSIVAPFVLGVVASLLLFPLLGDGDFTSFALFMGAAMSITAFPVLARILADTGLHRTRLGALAVTCAAIDDVTAWCVLSVVVAVAQASGIAGVASTAGLAAVYVVVLLNLVRPLLFCLLSPARGADNDQDSRHDRLGNQTTALLIALVLIGAWATEAIGIHAIFGAFLIGVIMPRDMGVADALTTKLGHVTELVLLPLFFVVAGLSTRVGLLESPLLWTVTALVIALAVLGKCGGSTLAARVCDMSWRDAVSLGVLMNTRGLTEIVILTIGLDLGIISPTLFTIMVMMALVTTVMTVPVLMRLGVAPDIAEMRYRLHQPWPAMSSAKRMELP